MELRVQSLSKSEIVLPCSEALKAIAVLMAARWAVFGWEGWVKRPDGSIGHHQDYQGTVSLERHAGETWDEFVRNAADLCRSTMLQDQRRFESDPECRDHTLYFCLSARPDS